MAVTIDWKNLGFKYMPTPYFVKCEYTNNRWGGLKVSEEPYLKLHIAATCLHYGHACFEGLKAFTQKSGTVAMFRPDENARRIQASAERLVMKAPPVELFVEACGKVVGLNRDYVPPHGTGASLYIRPVLIGSSPHVGLRPSEDFIFFVLCTPVGPYYKDGFFPVKGWVQEGYDRAAPRGVGNIKAAGNYAAGLLGDLEGKKKGFPISLYLDSGSHQHVDEFGTSNFVGITADKKYVTPHSTSILPSITNKSLQVLAQDFGFKVERRNIPVASLDTFVEVGACGTAAVITPVYSLQFRDKTFTFGKPDKAGETLTRLYKEIQGIQYGEIEDRHGWMVKV
jgi:branched-chain amino acid aminotransferase